MAEGLDIGGILGSFSGLATSQSATGWLSLGINIVLSTIVGGIVLLVVMEILGKSWGENVRAGRVFLLLLVINIINTFGFIYLISPFLSFVPMSVLFIPLLLWIALMKLFFSEMKFTHVIVTGIIGYALSIYAIPYVISLVRGFLPI